MGGPGLQPWSGGCSCTGRVNPACFQPLPRALGGSDPLLQFGWLQPRPEGVPAGSCRAASWAPAAALGSSSSNSEGAGVPTGSKRCAVLAAPPCWSPGDGGSLYQYGARTAELGFLLFFYGNHNSLVWKKKVEQSLGPLLFFQFVLRGVLEFVSFHSLLLVRRSSSELLPDSLKC